MTVKIFWHDWACPDCSGMYGNDFVVTNYHKGTWTCPECGCSTTSPVDDALIQMSTAYAIHTNIHGFTRIWKFDTEEERDGFVSGDDHEYECSSAIPASVAHDLFDNYNVAIEDY